MSRRDLILVAIFINVGVLTLLFISSLKPVGLPQNSVQELSYAAPLPQTTQPVAQIVAKGNEVEEIESSLNEEIAASTPSDLTRPEDILEPFLANDLLEVEVKKGDILGKIARRYGVSVEEIMKLNNLSGTSLRIGQVLYVPKKSPNRPSQQLVAQTGAQLALKDERYYTVKSGDSLWSIAVNNRIKVNDLLSLNGLSEKSAKRLKPGDRLRIQ